MADSGHPADGKASSRHARVALGAIYIATALLGTSLQVGGSSGLASLVDTLATGQELAAETLAMTAVLASGLVVTSAVGLFLTVTRRPTRRGWYASLALMALLIVLDISALSPRSPLRIPSAVGHAGLAGLLFALWWNQTSSRVRGRESRAST